jgi:hypothetical protein
MLSLLPPYRCRCLHHSTSFLAFRVRLRVQRAAHVLFRVGCVGSCNLSAQSFNWPMRAHFALIMVRSPSFVLNLHLFAFVMALFRRVTSPRCPSPLCASCIDAHRSLSHDEPCIFMLFKMLAVILHQAGIGSLQALPPF